MSNFSVEDLQRAKDAIIQHKVSELTLDEIKSFVEAFTNKKWTISPLEPTHDMLSKGYQRVQELVLMEHKDAFYDGEQFYKAMIKAIDTSNILDPTND